MLEMTGMACAADMRRVLNFNLKLEALTGASVWKRRYTVADTHLKYEYDLL